MKNNKGITLVALVVTIVVLLILAGVSINLVLGNNGIIAKAKEAETKSAEASQNDLKGMNGLVSEMEGALAGNGSTGSGSGNGNTGSGNNFVTKNTEVTYPDGKVWIPEGFKVADDSASTVQGGVVIEDKDRNQFVWVPVENAIKNTSTSITKQYTPMAMNQSGNNSKYYEGIYYAISDKGIFSYNLNCKIGTNVYREPSLVTINVNGSNIYTWDIENTIIKTGNRDTSKMFYKVAAGYNSAEEFGKHINEEYYNMINSVDKYGGFYIARYEASITGTDKTGIVVNSVPDKKPYSNSTWYYMNYYLDGNRYHTITQKA